MTYISKIVCVQTTKRWQNPVTFKIFLKPITQTEGWSRDKMNHHQGPSEYLWSNFIFYSKKLKQEGLRQIQKRQTIYPQTSNSGASFSKFVATTGSCTLHNQICTQTVNLRELVSMLIFFQCNISSKQLSSPLLIHAIFSAFSLTSCLHHTFVLHCSTFTTFGTWEVLIQTDALACEQLFFFFFFYFK